MHPMLPCATHWEQSVIHALHLATLWRTQDHLFIHPWRWHQNRAVVREPLCRAGRRQELHFSFLVKHVILQDRIGALGATLTSVSAFKTTDFLFLKNHIWFQYLTQSVIYQLTLKVEKHIIIYSLLTVLIKMVNFFCNQFCTPHLHVCF